MTDTTAPAILPNDASIESFGQPQVAMITVAQARSLAEDRVLAGEKIEAVNADLKARGIEQIAPPSPAVVAERQLAGLQKSTEWAAKVLASDPDALNQLRSLSATIANKGNEAPRAAVSDYSFPQAERGYDNAADFRASAADWAHDLKLEPGMARTVVSMAAESEDALAKMSPEKRMDFAIRNEKNFASTFDAASIKAAEATLAKHGRQIDLVGVARTAGALVAGQMVFHAQNLARRG
jgi:hypothetical protein